ncbi:DUF724 domain-containing protein 5-like isoform X2 [Punica granatum]|uniref:DUF724 domain-containing protein 5-like isoform X2 n=1 Tax=Punica granatum TaxID=22663 RepID=A0A6P8CKD7_PUNGR|nr:DUF724 domain-containing protein 5-like isoform X2 [Punica granatum]XP_031383789.1 DUF724 domain-containing protein 5-like isoform X2 [Punica granatum]XP_031383790.1 DUF724 domain-containing protein 5-like isoform X2 [Punica granatum]
MLQQQICCIMFELSVIQESELTDRYKGGTPPKFRISITTIGASATEGHSSLDDAEQALVREAETQAEMETPTAKMGIETPLDESDSSPFIKSSPVWKAVESMQVFEKFPQNPHFLPLTDYNKGSRGGLAIGHMVTFANVVDKAFRLKITDPVQSFITCLEALQPLESHGFNITAIEVRLMKMLSVIERLQKLDNEQVEVERRISELTSENIEIAKEIAKLNEKMRNLQDEHAYAIAMKKNKDSEITALRESLAAISASIQSIQLDPEDAT